MLRRIFLLGLIFILLLLPVNIMNSEELNSVPVLTIENNTHRLLTQNPFYNTTMNATFLLLQSGLWSEIQRGIILEPGEKIENFIIPIDEKINDSYTLYYGIFAEMTKSSPGGIIGMAFAYPKKVTPPQNPPPLPPLFAYPVDNPKKVSFNMYGYSSAPIKVGEGIFNLNSPPSKPDIFGPSRGKPGFPYVFIFNSVDPDGDDISYNIKWEDDNITDWTPYQNGLYEETHTWKSRGNYLIVVKAKDTLGLESEDARQEMTISRNKLLLRFFFSNFINNLPELYILFKILFTV